MAADAQGLRVTGSDESAKALDHAISDYFGWKGDPVGRLQDAVDQDPDFGLGSSAIASLFLLGGFRADHPRVATALSAAEHASAGAGAGATSRETRHLAAVKALAAGGLTHAVNIWETILVDHPTDALAMRFAHDAYFCLGQSLSIRDSIARVLPHWDPQGENYGYVLGQYAFGLEEAGELRRAEAFAHAAIARNAEDGWAIHARRLIDGVLAFAEGEYARAIELILPVRYYAPRIGGSHAQRDLITQTLIAAAERAGQLSLTRALLAERLAVRPTERTRQHYERVGGAGNFSPNTN